jgi:tellurite resistance protein TerC
MVKKILVVVTGTIVTVAGVALIVLPGPAFVVIPLGLGILAKEFVWARTLQERLKSSASKTLKKFQTLSSHDEAESVTKSEDP